MRDEDLPPVRRGGVSVLGIISLVMGFLGLPLSMIPCVNFLALPLVGIGLLLGIIGFFVAKSGQKGVGLPIAGMLVSLFGLMVSITWIGVMAYFVRAEQARQAKEEQEIREGVAITVTAVDLFEQYKADRADADSKYLGKVVELSGTVERVRGLIGVDDPVVELKTAEDDTIDCTFKRDHRQAVAKLVPGRQVTIRGKCKGKGLGGVTLQNCIFK